jgi:DHA1 family tetracycline resistance protein-like MFS transporter
MHEPKKAAKYPELFPLWISIFVDILGFTLLIPFLPFILLEMQIDTWLIGIVLSVNALFGFISGPIWGKASDKFGRKPILLICEIGTLFGFLMLSFSTNITMILISRMIDGIFGGIFPAARAAVADRVKPKDLAEEMSNVGVAHNLAAIFGPGIGGVLIGYGLIAPGLAASFLSLTAFVLTLIFFKETLHYAPQRKSGIEQLKNKTELLPSNNNPESINSQIESEIGQQQTEQIKTEYITTNIIEEGIQKKLKSKSLWRERLPRFFLIMWGFQTLSFVIFNTSVSLFSALVLNITAQFMGLLLTISGILRVTIRFTIFVPMLRKFGDRLTLIIGFVVFLISYFWLAFARDIYSFIIIIILISFAASCDRGVMNGYLAKSVEKRRGEIMGISSSLDSFSQIVGPIIGSTILGLVSPFWFGFLLFIIGIPPFSMALMNSYFQFEDSNSSLNE